MNALAWAEQATAHRRQQAGSVSTPWPIARRLVREALDAWKGPDPPTVLDPACGTGPFLAAAAEALWERAGAHDPVSRVAVLQRVVGWELDPHTAGVANEVLSRLAGAKVHCVQVRDGLAPTDERFDLVVGNPPWVGSTQMDRTHRDQLRARFTVTVGNWDLWCPFVEQALTLTRPHGVHAFIVPDKLASAEFAAPVRRLLNQRGLATLEDLGRAFPDHSVVGYAYRTGVPALPLADDVWPHIDDDTRPVLAALSKMPRLGDLAQVEGAATVAEAYAWGEVLTDGGTGHRLINSGLIDPWVTHWGIKPMRYLKRAWMEPRVPDEALTDRRRAQTASPKLVVAGMTRRLEAFADVKGAWLAAKSTTVVRGPQDIAGLAAWVNSRLAGVWYRATYGSLAFRGGYLRVGPPQLRMLPVPPLPDDVLDLARQAVTDPSVQSRIDDRLDAHLGVCTSHIEL